MFEIAEIIELAVQIEKNGEKIYRDALQICTDASLCAVLQRLADEEERHIEWFLKLREDVTSTTENPEIEAMGRSILLGMLGDQAFSLAEADMDRLEDFKTLVETAIEFERDTIVFYEMLSSMVEDESTLAVLETIINEEKQHVSLFQEIQNKKDPYIKDASPH